MGYEGKPSDGWHPTFKFDNNGLTDPTVAIVEHVPWMGFQRGVSGVLTRYVDYVINTKRLGQSYIEYYNDIDRQMRKCAQTGVLRSARECELNSDNVFVFGGHSGRNWGDADKPRLFHVGK